MMLSKSEVSRASHEPEKEQSLDFFYALKNHLEIKTRCSFLVEDIPYHLTPREKVVELAKIAARTIPNFDTFLNLFEIKDPASLAEIAKIVAEHIIFMIKEDRRKGFHYVYNDHDFNIKSYSIEDQKDLMDIAMMLAEEYPEKLYCQMGDFGINEEENRITLAIKVAENTDDQILAMYIKGFKIANPQALYEIAMILAKKPISQLFLI